MFEISQTIKAEMNLETFKVIDSLFMGPSLLGTKSCWACVVIREIFGKIFSDVFSSSSVTQ